MKIAVISDIHSNIYALEAVLKDIESRDIEMVVCTGDLVGYGTRPNEVINAIRKNRILTIMGNYDDAIGNHRLVCGCDYPDPKDAEKAGASMSFTLSKTTEENKLYLKNLPREVVLSFNQKNIRFVHGSTRLINEYLKEDSIQAQEVMNEITEDILVCGHTHIPYFKEYNDKLLINAGSVGKPKTNKPDSNYVIIEIKNTNEDLNIKEAVNVEIIEVPYDYGIPAKEIESEEMLPNDFAKLLRSGNAK